MCVRVCFCVFNECCDDNILTLGSSFVVPVCVSLFLVRGVVSLCVRVVCLKISPLEKATSDPLFSICIGGGVWQTEQTASVTR